MPVSANRSQLGVDASVSVVRLGVDASVSVVSYMLMPMSAVCGRRPPR